MAGGVQVSKRPIEMLPEEKTLKDFVLWQTNLSMAGTGLGYLALTWSTVVLLGGFVSTLGKKDFWCLTTISMIQAARIFDDAEDQRMPKFSMMPMEERDNISELTICLSQLSTVVTLGIRVVYEYKPFICVGLSLWRLAQRDYGNIDGEGTQANLMPALVIFYSLVLCQGTLLLILSMIKILAAQAVVSLCRACKLPEKWAAITIEDYWMDTRAKCMQNPASIEGTSLVGYAVDLLGSESSQGYLSGARMLELFIKQGVDVRSLLLHSRPKIQKLIDTLKWRSSDREIRELAARILAYLAWDIDLTKFLGATRCISSLLDTTLPYWSNQQETSHQSPLSRFEHSTSLLGRLYLGEERQTSHVKKLEQHGEKKKNSQDSDQPQGEGGSSSINETEGNCWNELILQGLTILERLASDQHNCSDICGTPYLVHKIMAPLYSKTLIQDIGISSWADVVNGSLKVVHVLIHSPEGTGKSLAHDISSSKQAVSNLEWILSQGNKAGKQLQMLAMVILTELTFDSSTNLTPETKENLIKKQMEIFLADDEGEDENLKIMAGQTLSGLSKTEYLSDTGNGSAFITSRGSYLVDRLTEILDGKNKIIYRAIAAEVLVNLITHHTLDWEHVKNTLLPKVLKEILTTKLEPRQERPNYDENHGVSLERNDEEKQLSEHKDQFNSPNQADEEHTTMMKFHEALLSLTLAICNKLISADDFDDVALGAPGEGDFVVKLRIMVEENCEATANSLRIVKLCGQIAVTMMRRSLYIPHFKDQHFVETLSMASRIMGDLESCMLFAGTYGGAQKTTDPSSRISLKRHKLYCKNKC